MSDSKLTGLLVASLALNGLALAAIGWIATHPVAAPEAAVPEGIEELTEEVGDARLEMRRSIERLEAMISRVSAGGGGGGGGKAAYAFDAEAELGAMTPDDLFARWVHVCEVLSRNRDNPLSRETVETERGRVEAEMRKRGDATVATIQAKWTTVEDTWLKTRLLTNLVGVIATEPAFAFANTVFDDTSLPSRLRLQGAAIAMQRPGDEGATVGRLIELLQHPDSSFDRRDDIVTFLKTTPDPRAVPALVAIARSQETEQNLRTRTIEALGSYPVAESVEALRELAFNVTLGNLRIEAVRSLHKIQGKEVLDLVKKMRDTIGMEDQMLTTFLDNIEGQYQ